MKVSGVDLRSFAGWVISARGAVREVRKGRKRRKADKIGGEE